MRRRHMKHRAYHKIGCIRGNEIPPKLFGELAKCGETLQGTPLLTSINFNPNMGK